METIDKCAICQERLKNDRSLPCLHSFCLGCLQDYFKNKGSFSPSLLFSSISSPSLFLFYSLTSFSLFPLSLLLFFLSLFPFSSKPNEQITNNNGVNVNRRRCFNSNWMPNVSIIIHDSRRRWIGITSSPLFYIQFGESQRRNDNDQRSKWYQMSMVWSWECQGCWWILCCLSGILLLRMSKIS